MHQNLKQPNHYYFELIITIGLYTIIPFLLLCAFNQPTVDDFDYAFRDSQNDFLTTQAETYYNWSGRYFSTAISRINPIRFGSWVGYKIGSLLIIASIVLSIYALISTLSRKSRLKAKLSLTALFTILYFSLLPDISRGFYYMTHYFVYQLPNILTIVFLILLLNFIKLSNRSTKLIYLGGMIAVCVAIVGINELSLIYLMTTLAFIVFNAWRSSHPAFKYMLFVFTCSLIACLAMILAPGNYVRMGLQSGDTGNFLWSVLASIILIPTYFYKWGLSLAVVSILYLLLWRKVITFKAGYNALFKTPLSLSVSVFLITLFLMNFAYTWSVGGVPMDNVENVIYFYFVLGWFYNLHILMEKFSLQFRQIRYSPVLASFVMFTFLLLVFNIDNNISTAYLDLLSGKAERHNRELNDRYAFLKTSGCQNCIVKPLSEMPKSLYIYDLTPYIEGTESPVNAAMRKYFKKESIYLSSPGPTGYPTDEDNLTTLHAIGRKLKHKVLGDGH